MFCNNTFFFLLNSHCLIIVMGLCFPRWTTRSVIHTNNGVERKNKDFKHQYLAQFKDKSLSGMITVLIEQFLPDKEKRLVGLLHLFVTSFNITHHHWPTSKQWLYISKGIKHPKLIFYIYFYKIAFSWHQLF